MFSFVLVGLGCFVSGRRIYSPPEQLPAASNIVGSSIPRPLNNVEVENKSLLAHASGQLKQLLLSTAAVANPLHRVEHSLEGARHRNPMMDRTALADPNTKVQFQPQKHSVSLVALGCPKNTVDAEVMLGDLQRSGIRVTKDPQDADIVIVNTCAFVEDAKSESIQAVMDAGHLKEDERVPVRGLFVTGCLAQRYADELANELPEVDAVVGFEHYADLPEKVHELLARKENQRTIAETVEPNVLVGSPDVPFRSEEERVMLTPKHLAYMRVAEGCDHACTFCAIPGFRGKFRSKPFDVVVAEAERLVSGGCRELNLIAEDTNQYGSDWGASDPRRLADLLHALSEIPDLKWIRLLYCYPSYFSEELIDAIASIDKVCKYIDIPLQHLSPTVLKRMRRPPQKSTVDLLKKLRARIPDLTLRTTFISGFPGETDADHDELTQLVEELRFERGGAFAYSSEEGTPAHDMEDHVDHDIKESRRDSLMAIFQSNEMAWAQEQIGREVSVIIDGMEGTDAVGRTMADAYDIDGRVTLPNTILLPGMVVKAKIVNADMMDLIAIPVED